MRTSEIAFFIRVILPSFIIAPPIIAVCDVSHVSFIKMRRYVQLWGLGLSTDGEGKRGWLKRNLNWNLQKAGSKNNWNLQVCLGRMLVR